MAKGNTNKEIGEELNISEATVKQHLKGIFRKTHAKSRIEAVVKSIKEKLIYLDRIL
jgi:two-component system response regulator DegU